MVVKDALPPSVSCVQTLFCANKSRCHHDRGQEKTRHVAYRRHDTLCVRGVFSLFLLEQQLAAFGDSNPGGKTTLIVTINTSLVNCTPYNIQVMLSIHFRRQILSQHTVVE
jgi:hypothetical protein